MEADKNGLMNFVSVSVKIEKPDIDEEPPITTGSGQNDDAGDQFAEECFEEFIEDFFKNSFKCQFCDVAFASSFQMEKHKKLSHFDLERNNFTCPICSKPHNSLATLGAHFDLEHIKTERFQCKICNNKFFHKSAIMKHLQEFHKELINPNCLVKFKSEDELWKHLALIHDKFKSKVKKSKPQKQMRDPHDPDQKFECQVCSSTFLTKTTLTHHLADVHGNLRPWTCKLCSSSFTFDHWLKRHMRKSHDPKRPFSCPQCKWTFNYQSSMNRHPCATKNAKNSKKKQSKVKRERKTGEVTVKIEPVATMSVPKEENVEPMDVKAEPVLLNEDEKE